MSCLFDSLSPSVNINSKTLRQVICNYLDKDPELIDDIKASDIIQWTEECNLKNYISKMSKNSQWGGEIEIKSFCNIFKMDVTVHVLYTGKKFTTTTINSTHDVNISYTGSHFEHLYILTKI